MNPLREIASSSLTESSCLATSPTARAAISISAGTSRPFAKPAAETSFFASADYAPLAEVAGALDGLIQADATVSRGARSHPVRDFDETQQFLLEEAKKGRTIQRFKGLGEMNPEQLWETTVNPDTRRLLQVRIEDAVAADQIFSTLMGDVVEPRRQFIEQNALRVSNLDV